MPWSLAASAPGLLRPLHTVAGVLAASSFHGHLDAPGGRRYEFAFKPASLSRRKRDLEFRGTFEVRAKRQAPRVLEGLRARVAGSQAGVLFHPGEEAFGFDCGQEHVLEEPHPGLGTGDAATSGTPVGQGGERPQPFSLPRTEVSGPRSFLSAVYLRLDPLDNAALKLPFKMSALQINCRLHATDPVGRRLTLCLSRLLQVSYEEPESTLIAGLMERVNGILSATHDPAR